MSTVFFLLSCILLAAAEHNSFDAGDNDLERVRRAQPASEIITLYKGENFTGASLQLRVPYGNHCVDLIPEWNDAAISIDPGTLACVIVFEDRECSGRGVRLQDFTFGTMNLDSIGLKKAVSSARLCQR